MGRAAALTFSSLTIFVDYPVRHDIMRWSTLLFFALGGVRFSEAATVSITTQRILSAQRNCVSACIAGGYGMKNIIDGVGCGNDNDCLCKAGVTSAASSWLSFCITTAFTTCADGDEYASAVSIYDNYCRSTGPASVSATPTDSGQTELVQTVTVTTTSTPFITIQSSDSSTTTPTSESFLLLALFNLLYINL